MDLSKVSEREALKARREPYWQRLRPGCFVGYRPAAKGGAGTWIARAYDEEARRYQLKALGSFGEAVARDRFTLAKQAAEAFAAKVEGGSVNNTKIETVEDACREFAKHNTEAAGRFRRYVYADPIAKVKLEKLRRSNVAAWRRRLETTPALVSRRNTGEPLTRDRSPATLNRDMAVLRTALGRVLPLGTPNTEAAWQEPLKPVKNAVKRRTLYLNRDQRKALVAAVPSEAQGFVRTLCLLPLRPGAAAALTVADFDKRTSELTIGKDKTGNRRRIVVPDVAANLFANAAQGKLPGAPLFMRANGKAWDKETWNDPIAHAAKAAKLPAAVTAYTLRHSTITDLVSAGLPLLTVAQISGTSAEMIEKHYGHLVRDAAVEALAGLAV
ncbi:tyrosine-type recombinase/integrase [Sphingomonas sp. SM33]|uniref:Tyrosine-type recombinase/integrase n=1 Tax=Sphingomonas telluris TaxID=2907998 RepID=A0ABS9VR80_9SPHN|nr:tyrosine-type recombinase/integrase [Sphingomonas telluris]MCH8617474.1 tyrosine-type recombinase/integrase [Sphingomonas telluris]